MTGRLLVASTRLADPNFERTVVIVLDHGAEGALGVVLNRPTPVPVVEILATWEDQADLAPPGVVFRGGPVSPDAVIGLARTTEPVDAVPAWRATVSAPGASVGTVDLAAGPTAQPVPLAGARLFSGYAGWGPGQLEDEIAERAWFVLDATVPDLLCDDPDRLWHDVVRRQGGELALLAAYPPHPMFN